MDLCDRKHEKTHAKIVIDHINVRNAMPDFSTRKMLKDMFSLNMQAIKTLKHGIAMTRSPANLVPSALQINSRLKTTQPDIQNHREDLRAF